MSYWLIAVPNKTADDEQQIKAGATKKYIDERTVTFSMNHIFNIPDLKVGTMDSLMSLSEEMSKIDQIVGSIAKKLERGFQESCKEGDEKSKDGENIPELKVGNLSPLKYIEKFEWDVARYPKRGNLKQLVENILKEAAKHDEELRKHQQDYNEVRQQYTAIERKETGTLLVKPLSAYVKPSHVVETEHLTTLLIVVPKSKEEEFFSTYEILEDIAAEKEEARAREREEQLAADKERREEEEEERAEKAAKAAKKKAANQPQGKSQEKSQAKPQEKLPQEKPEDKPAVPKVDNDNLNLAVEQAPKKEEKKNCQKQTQADVQKCCTSNCKEIGR